MAAPGTPFTFEICKTVVVLQMLLTPSPSSCWTIRWQPKIKKRTPRCMGTLRRKSKRAPRCMGTCFVLFISRRAFTKNIENHRKQMESNGNAENKSPDNISYCIFVCFTKIWATISLKTLWNKWFWAFLVFFIKVIILIFSVPHIHIYIYIYVCVCVHNPVNGSTYVFRE